MYDNYALPYATPTIGLWFLASDYIRFLKNLDFYMMSEMVQITWKEFNNRELLEQRAREGKYPKGLDKLLIGRIYDVDIVFLHYSSFDEAKVKWNRRKSRLNMDKLLVKFNDQNCFKPEDYEEFKKLNYKHKIFITANPKYKSEKDVIFIGKFENDGYVVDDTNLKNMPFPITDFLNNIF